LTAACNALSKLFQLYTGHGALGSYLKILLLREVTTVNVVNWKQSKTFQGIVALTERSC
jgi:hypothetical protein